MVKNLSICFLLHFLKLSFHIIISFIDAKEFTQSFQGCLIFPDAADFTKNQPRKTIAIPSLFIEPMFKCTLFFRCTGSNIYSLNTLCYIHGVDSSSFPSYSSCKKEILKELLLYRADHNVDDSTLQS